MTARRGGRGEVRIIAGAWRGRRLPVPPVDGLRPTPDRLRETLFNWLAPILPGARCLDLFAGSGVLGLEAASRGAGEVVMVERDGRCAAGIRASVARLGAANVTVHVADALAWLGSTTASFDVVFLDPPYASDLLAASCRALAASERLRDGAFVYLELAAGTEPPELPPGWEVHRRGRAGHAQALLARVAR